MQLGRFEQTIVILGSIVRYHNYSDNEADGKPLLTGPISLDIKPALACNRLGSG